MRSAENAERRERPRRRRKQKKRGSEERLKTGNAGLVDNSKRLTGSRRKLGEFERTLKPLHGRRVNESIDIESGR
jgi:hypothetical protein